MISPLFLLHRRVFFFFPFSILPRWRNEGGGMAPRHIPLWPWSSCSSVERPACVSLLACSVTAGEAPPPSSSGEEEEGLFGRLLGGREREISVRKGENNAASRGKNRGREKCWLFNASLPPSFPLHFSPKATSKWLTLHPPSRRRRTKRLTIRLKGNFKFSHFQSSRHTQKFKCMYS